MKMQLKLLLSGVLTLALLLSLCAEGVCNSGTAESSNVAQGKSLLFPAERTLSPTATTAPLPSRQA